MLVKAHALCGCSDLQPRRVRLHLWPAASTRDLDTTPPASCDIQRSLDRVLPPHLTLLRPSASWPHFPQAPAHKTHGNVGRWERLSQPPQRARAPLSFAPTRTRQTPL